MHIIFSLGRGGAETILVTTTNELTEFNNIILTLFNDNHFKDEMKNSREICLNLKLWQLIFFFPLIAFKVRRVIQKNDVDLVHSRLFWPTIIARLATPKRLPLITTIHAYAATSVDYKFWYYKLMDQLTYRLRKNIMVSDSAGALNEYFSFLKLKPYKTANLNTLVDVRKFNEETVVAEKRNDGIFRLISVGALRVQKNQRYLIEAMTKIKEKPVELHIYGLGPLQEDLQKQITQTGAKVELKGQVKNIQDIIKQYDVFVMASTFEGLSLAVLEAMAMCMPLLLSNIPSFKEQCEDTALYFELGDIKSFLEKLEMLQNNIKLRHELGEAAKKRVLDNFTLEHHMRRLREVYADALSN